MHTHFAKWAKFKQNKGQNGDEDRQNKKRKHKNTEMWQVLFADKFEVEVVDDMHAYW